MKKILLIALLAFCMNAKAQHYIPFPDSNAVWRVDASTACPVNYIVWANSYYQYTMGGDTTIGLYTYKKIYQSGMFGGCLNDDSTSSTYGYYYQGGLRQDSINKKVYFKYPSCPDTLIYDFSKQIGDTLNIVYCTYCTSGCFSFPVTISSIDSVLVGSNYHKQFHFISSSHTIVQTIIEGIGSTGGLLEPIYAEGGETWNLVCFSHNTDNYPDSSTSCKLITGISELPFINNQVNIFPNPASSEIKVIGNQYSVNGIDIYNMLGERVYQSLVNSHSSSGIQPMTNAPMTNTPITINVSALPPGMYFMEIRTENGVEVKKFVKQ
jgi:hypothetical protein